MKFLRRRGIVRVSDGWCSEDGAFRVVCDAAEAWAAAAGDTTLVILALGAQMSADRWLHRRDLPIERRRSSRRFAVVIAQQPAQALAAYHFTGRPSGLCAWLNQPVADSLMTSLGMKMLNERTCGSLQCLVSEEDHPLQALLLHTAHESLDMRGQIRRPRRQPQHPGSLTSRQASRGGLSLGGTTDSMSMTYSSAEFLYLTGWETEIGLTNTSEAAIRGILRAYPATGGPALQSLEIVIPASGREEVTVGQSFVNARQIAYMVFESDSGFVAGYTRFNQPGNRVSLAVTSGVDRGWFAKMEKLGWTGIAFVNLNAGDSTVSLSAWSADGSQVGGKVVVLKSGEKFVGTVEQLFGSDLSNARYFRFTSDRKVIAFTVSGSADGQMLDGLGSLGRYVSQ